MIWALAVLIAIFPWAAASLMVSRRHHSMDEIIAMRERARQRR